MGGLPSLPMGWDQSPVDGNGMGWETSGAGMEWYMTPDKIAGMVTELSGG